MPYTLLVVSLLIFFKSSKHFSLGKRRNYAYEKALEGRIFLSGILANNVLLSEFYLISFT